MDLYHERNGRVQEQILSVYFPRRTLLESYRLAGCLDGPEVSDSVGPAELGQDFRTRGQTTQSYAAVCCLRYRLIE